FDDEFTIDNNNGGGGHKFHNTHGLIVLIAKPFKLPTLDKKSKIMMPMIIEATRDVNNKNLIKWNVVDNYQQRNNNHHHHNNHRQSSTTSLNNNNELIPLSRGRFWSPQQAKLAKFKFLNFRKRFFPI
ncbi:hypothetical protein BLA29_010206, partial [Euroglyphus maynei]